MMSMEETNRCIEGIKKEAKKDERQKIIEIIEERRKQDIRDLVKKPKQIYGEILEELYDKFDDDLASEIFSLLTMRGRDMYIQDLKQKLEDET